MTKRALVLGSLGMLGHQVLLQLLNSPAIEAVGTYNTKIPADVAKYKKFCITCSEEQILNLISGFDYIVNCIATLKSAINEDDPESVKNAFLVNSEFPVMLANLASRIRIKIIHISTDGVFSGDSQSPFNELSTANPEDIYGKSKLQGEVTSGNVLNIRTSIIGRDPHYQRGLLEWFLKQPDNSSISGFDDIWHGVTNKQLAVLIKNILEKDMFDDIVRESSIHHFCPNLPITKAQLLAIFRVMFDKDIIINEVANPKGPINRILSTCFETLKSCYESTAGIQAALNELK